MNGQQYVQCILDGNSGVQWQVLTGNQIPSCSSSFVTSGLNSVQSIGSQQTVTIYPVGFLATAVTLTISSSGGGVVSPSQLIFPAGQSNSDILTFTITAPNSPTVDLIEYSITVNTIPFISPPASQSIIYQGEGGIGRCTSLLNTFYSGGGVQGTGSASLDGIVFSLIYLVNQQDLHMVFNLVIGLHVFYYVVRHHYVYKLFMIQVVIVIYRIR